MRSVQGLVMLVLATARPAGAQPGPAAPTSLTPAPSALTPASFNLQCFTVTSTLRPQGRESCHQDCADAREFEKQSSGFVSATECMPAPAIVWCSELASAVTCFRSKELCEDADPRFKMAQIAKKPRPDIDPCKRLGPEVATSSEVPPETAEPRTAAIYVPEPPPGPPDILVVGSYLSAGEDADSSNGGALGVEYRSAGSGRFSLARGFDAELNYSEGRRGVGGRIAARAGIGVNLKGGGSLGLMAGVAYGGIERSAAELPFELFVNGTLAGIGVMLRYEQVHRFVDNQVMPGEEEPRWMNASGLTLWIAIAGGARHPLACVGFKMQSRDDTDAAFLSVAVGAPAPGFF